MALVLDRDTAETVRQMVRYIASDRKIARHVGCSIEHVAKARRLCRPSDEDRLITRPLKAPHPEILDANADHWAVEARKATERLAEAIVSARLG